MLLLYKAQLRDSEVHPLWFAIVCPIYVPLVFCLLPDDCPRYVGVGGKELHDRSVHFVLNAL